MTPLNIFKTKKQKEEEKKEEVKEEKNNQVKKENGAKLDYFKIKPILIEPYLTEKASQLQSLNKYVFEVDKKINKIELKKFIEKFYNVKVEKVNFVSLKVKKKRFGRKITTFKPKKKAIVTLKEGYKIEI